MSIQFLRFKDLQKRGIVSNRPTLRRWILFQDFPRGRLLGPNTRVWTEAEIDEWTRTRPAARALGQSGATVYKKVDRFSKALETASSNALLSRGVAHSSGGSLDE